MRLSEAFDGIHEADLWATIGHVTRPVSPWSVSVAMVRTAGRLDDNRYLGRVGCRIICRVLFGSLFEALGACRCGGQRGM